MTPLDPHAETELGVTRRAFLGRSSAGLGAAALASLLGPAEAALGGADRRLVTPHHAPKAKRVIYLFMNGGPTHVDLFDYKPDLARLHGTPIPDSVLAGKRFSTMTGDPTGKVLLRPMEAFKQYGQCGAWASGLVPHTGAIADELCFLKGMHTEQVNHAPAVTFFLTGSEFPGRPTMGSWLSYGLGSADENLPTYCAMSSVSKGTTCGQIFYEHYWGSGFLPSQHQGVKFRGGGDPVLYLSNPDGVPAHVRRGILDDLARLNELQRQHLADPEIDTRISQYELAYRMQTSVPELTDLSDEPEHVLAMYGPQVRERGTFAYNCLMARRLAERGVRFTQVMHAGWDQHRSLTNELYTQCMDTDQPSAGLVMDLKQRGMLDDTLVIWGGEFGRTPFLQGDIENRPKWGRDHHPYAFTMWMAGAGVKPGHTHGASDAFGMDAIDGRVHVHDFQATVLRLLGFDHEKLTYKHKGRRFRLTDVHGHVVDDILT
ncbi:MAG: DUF1501 domain-containing protein [Planctomycetota bacterium]